MADNIIVGIGPGMESQIKVFSSTLPDESGKAPDVFSTLHAVPRIAVGCDPGHRHGRVGLGPGEHRHGARPGRCAARQDVPVGPVHADRAGAGQRHRAAGAFGQAERPEDDVAVHGRTTRATRTASPCRRVGRGCRGRRQEHRHQPARRRRHGAGVVERVAARRSARRSTWTTRTITSRTSSTPRSRRSPRSPARTPGVTVATTQHHRRRRPAGGGHDARRSGGPQVHPGAARRRTRRPSRRS